MKIIAKYWLLVALWVSASVFPAQAQSPTLDPSFIVTSAVRMNFGGMGAVWFQDVLRQPDGKLVVAGDFRSINGRPALRVARLLPDGQVDTTFTAPPADGDISTVALQADGKLLVGGRFTTLGGQSRIGIARLLSTGALDPGFFSPFGGGPPPFAYSDVTKIVVQPGRGILVLGGLTPIGSTGPGTVYVARLLEATGARDATFQPAFTTFDTRDVLVRPGGELVFAGRPHQIGGQPCLVWGTLPDGALDPAFVPLPGPDPLSQSFGLARDPATGHLYVMATNAGTGLRIEPVRLLPTGVRDPSFSTAGVFLPVGGGVANSLAVQPNGRLLLGGDFPNPGGGFFGSCRLLPGGALDPSYNSRRGPYTTVSKVLVQPDGALLFAGIFQEVVGLPVSGLARMLDPNVLSAHAPASPDDEPALLAWPVPARDVLHLRLPAGRMARQAALLDALGRVMLCQTLLAGQLVPVLPTAGLPPGGYLLRVTFASGPPAYRRVVVE